MAGKALPIGGTGQLVARNVRAIRRRQALTQEDLSAQLDRLGRPIAVPGLRALENGKRRVDVDDLTALSMALGTHPADLLALPEQAEFAVCDPQPTGSTKAFTAGEVEAWMEGRIAHLAVDDVVEYWKSYIERNELLADAFRQQIVEDAASGAPDNPFAADRMAARASNVRQHELRLELARRRLADIESHGIPDLPSEDA